MTNAIVVILFALAVIILGPLATIWSLNTLFPIVNIPFDFDHWAAALILGGLFKTTVSKK